MGGGDGGADASCAIEVQPPARVTAGRKWCTPTSVALAAARLAVLVAAVQVSLAVAQAAGCPVEPTINAENAWGYAGVTQI